MKHGDSITWRRATLALTWASSLVLVSVLGTRAAPPPPSSRTQLTFQSKLTSPGGQPLAGEYPFKFLVYTVPVGGVPIWSETHDGTALPLVRVANGVLSAVLGQAVPLDATVFDPGGTDDRFMAVELAGAELCRVKLTATAYAVSATVANALWNPVTSTSLDAQALEARYVDTDEVAILVPPATTAVAGKVVLAAPGATTAGAAVQGSDPRLSGISVRTNAGTTGRRAQINLIAGPNVTIGAVDDAGSDEVDVTITATGGGSGSGGLTNVVLRVFDSAGTHIYNPTTNMTHCQVICTGGGGGGGGADGDGSNGQAVAAGGGGGGSTSIRVLTAAEVGGSQTVTVGAGGTAGTSSGADGGDGGQTSLGSLVVAPGGTGGRGAFAAGGGFVIGFAGGAGGSKSSTSSILGSNGGRGDWGLASSGNAPPGFTRGGNGGGSYFSSGGSGAMKFHTSNGSTAGHAGDGYGAGGGGAAHVNTAIGAPGGAGKVGVCVIVEYVQ